MNRLVKDLRLVRIMMTEERRMNASMIGKAQFLMFPLVILIMGLVLSLSSKQLVRAMPMDQMYLVLHSVVLLYGLAVGGFSLFSERIAEKRFGQVSLLLETPRIQPVDFRTMFMAFYVKDLIYYMLYSIVPIIAGIALSIPFTGFRITSVLFLLLTMTLTFLLGISFSFLLSSIYVRWRGAFAVLVGGVAALFAYGYLSGTFGLGAVPSIAYQLNGDPTYLLVSISLFVVFSAVAIVTIRVRAGKASMRHEPTILATAKRFAFARKSSVLMAKDWIDLLRSRTLLPVIGAYVGPLAFLALLLWFVGSVLALPIRFNMMFYAGMIGFFSVSIYGWLNMLDTAAFMEVLPMDVAQVIRAKLNMLTILAMAISTAFLIALSVLQNELSLVPLTLIVAYTLTAFTVAATAYLTGLRTNSYLFDPTVLGKFAGITVPPLVAITILSFQYERDPLVVTALTVIICVALVVATHVMMGRLRARWGRESFLF